MKVGFTGTREGLTQIQFYTFQELWASIGPVKEFHHGACFGADFQVAFHVHNMNEPEADLYSLVVAHPSNFRSRVSDAALSFSGLVHPEAPPLERNRDIVRLTDTLIACPKGPEERRSGTWSTVRHARKLKNHIIIVWPDGKVTEEWPIQQPSRQAT